MGQQLALPLPDPLREAVLRALGSGPARVPELWRACGVQVPPAGGVADVLRALRDEGLVRCGDDARWEAT